MSSATGDERRTCRAAPRAGWIAGLRQIAFFVVPSAVAFLALGDVIAGALYQSGAFTRTMTVYVWGILAGSAVGLLASTLGRLYASTYYALHDTRTPLRSPSSGSCSPSFSAICSRFRCPVCSVSTSGGEWPDSPPRPGSAGWVEFILLRRALNRRIGRTGMPLPY